MTQLPPGRVKACTECRQQKQRCDAYMNYDSPCSRCKKFELECVITNDFHRRKKRSKRELQREIELLKNQMGAGSRPSVREHDDGNDSDSSDVKHSQTFDWPVETGDSNEISPEVNRGTHSSHLESALGSHLAPLSNGSSTVAQSLVDVTVGAKEIDDCFALFNKHYAPHLPGLFDPVITPNSRFQQSPFLFWTIVCTGSRRYVANPNIFTRLSRRMIGFALSSLISNARPIPAIQAIILLCNWPIPSTSIYHDPAHGLAGAALNLATQNGLHVLCREAEFAKRPKKQRQAILQLQGQPYEAGPSIDGEIMFRLRLWAHCLITLQRTSLCDGLPFASVSGPTEIAGKSVLKSVLDPFLYFRYQLHSIQATAVNTIVRSVRLESANGAEDTTLISLIDIFDTQLAEVEITSRDDKEMAPVMKWCARLSIRMFCFFLKSTTEKLKHVLQAVIAALEAIEHIWRFQCNHGSFVPHMSHYEGRMLIMAAFTLMRTMRSPHKEMFQPARSETAFNRATAMIKAFSVQSEDLSEVAVRMVEHLLASKRSFIQEDGTNTSLELKLRGRLFMSVVFDCFWWWRLGPGSQSQDPEPPPTNRQEPTPTSESNCVYPSLSPDDLSQLRDLQNQIYEPLLENSFFPDVFMDVASTMGLSSPPVVSNGTGPPMTTLPPPVQNRFEPRNG